MLIVEWFVVKVYIDRKVAQRFGMNPFFLILFRWLSRDLWSVGFRVCIWVEGCAAYAAHLFITISSVSCKP